jgi:hypothetical protein
MVEVRRLAPLVFATADYLASRFYWNESDGGGGGRWWLGPPVMGGEESSGEGGARGEGRGGNGHSLSPPSHPPFSPPAAAADAFRTFNPTFETVYSAYVLDVANDWRGLLGLAPDPAYASVAGSLASLPIDAASPPAAPLYSLNLLCACMYLEGGAKNASCEQAFLPPGGSSCSATTSHPLVVAPLGMVNGRARGGRYGVNATTANATVAAVLANWGVWGGTWGWDDGLLALAMTRLGWDPGAVVGQARRGREGGVREFCLACSDRHLTPLLSRAHPCRCSCWTLSSPTTSTAKRFAARRTFPATAACCWQSQ